MLARVVVLTARAGLSMPQHWVCVCVVGGVGVGKEALVDGGMGRGCGCRLLGLSDYGLVGLARKGLAGHRVAGGSGGGVLWPSLVKTGL